MDHCSLQEEHLQASQDRESCLVGAYQVVGAHERWVQGQFGSVVDRRLNGELSLMGYRDRGVE